MIALSIAVIGLAASVAAWDAFRRWVALQRAGALGEAAEARLRGELAAGLEASRTALLDRMSALEADATEVRDEARAYRVAKMGKRQ